MKDKEDILEFSKKHPDIVILDNKEFKKLKESGRNEFKAVEKWLKTKTDVFDTMEFESRWNKFKQERGLK